MERLSSMLELSLTLGTIAFICLVLAVGVAVWSAWRRDVSGAVSSVSSALFMAALLVGGWATMILGALALACFAWWVIRQQDRTTRG